MPKRDARLKATLEEWYAAFHRPEFLATDPLCLVHRYRTPEDQELVALLAAAFASGNIRAIIAAVSSILNALGDSPAATLRAMTAEQAEAAFASCAHRWVKPTDVTLLLLQLGAVLREHGPLGELWRRVDQDKTEDLRLALGRFVRTITQQQIPGVAVRARSARLADGTERPLPPIGNVLLSDPAQGSACKRMHLFLRWMARPADGIDTGLWTPFLSPSRLFMPIDTHVLRIARALHLTDSATPTARVCVELTDRFRTLNPDDPCRYDFSLVRAGIARQL